MGRVGFTTRTLATFLDWILIILLSGMTFFVCLKSFPEILGNVGYGKFKGLPQLPMLAASAVSFLYLFIEVFCASPGKLIFGLYIGDSEGQKAKLMRRIFRLIFKIPGIAFIVIIIFIAFLGFVLSEGSKDLGLAVIMFGISLFPIAGIANFIATLGCFMALSYSQETLHDRLSGTGIFYGPFPTTNKSTFRFDTNKNMPQPQQKNNLAVNKLLFK
ncbi:MAG: RDD family protein [bacterium]|nr:RDD family protein [bacterium]